ncbi:RHS repeat protein [Bradyrhizobium sp. PRIMUS42]|uniref:RHS repeat protein n=1 Tax=Bradyrhizobium sp. PRIMUS42 TaxID=2908926 RepID=UPI001FF352F9|nr:RHS repeat protein [Bradyrhizobium sp. PRIMUS42]MCJ9729115.1 RHS repeat protein [Bradyrhizobium sp. PRIMUS42]
MSDQTILSASGFINSIGVNTHAGFGWTGYNNLALMVDDLEYLGVTHLRDAMGTSPAAQPVVDGLAAAGYKFDFLVSSALPQTGTVGLQNYIASLQKFVTNHAGSISAIEGLNEANHQPFSYNGSSSLTAAAQFQSALYQAVNANAALGSIPVYNLSLAYNDPQGYSQLGNMSGSVDYANAHAYVSTSLNPSSSIAATLSAVMAAAPGKPVVITETGYTTQANTQYLGVNETVQAKSILNTLTDAYKAGVSATYLYELFDRDSSAGNTNPEANFGLFNSDGTPKLAATAIHNLTTILADDGKGGLQPTDPLNYTLSNMPASGNSMVLGKSNGAYELVVWAEPKLWKDANDTEISNPTETVTVNLGGVHHSVKVYDTLTGTTAIASYTDVSTITIPVSDHPLIIEIDAPPTTSTPPDTRTSITGTAAEIVPQLSDLSESTALQTITLTDSHVLPVASKATMDYMIAHYGSALSKIQGGYSFSVTNAAATWSNTKTYSASGTLLSKSDTGLNSSGQPTSTTVAYTDGSKDLISYTNGVQTKFVHVGTDATRTTDTYNTAGVLLSEVVQKSDGYYSTTLYTSGVKTAGYVKNADGSQDNYTYGITGKSFTTQVQHLDASGKVTSVTRSHADGSLDSTQVYNSDGSSVITTYSATGVKLVETAYHADHSKDVWTYNITGQSYATEHDVYNSTGFLTSLTRLHGDGSLAFKLIQTPDGTKTTDWYNAAGSLTSEVVQKADGYTSTTVYSNGVKTNTYVKNADGSQDNYAFGITGQSYTTLIQHVDPSGKVTAVTRKHADGTLDYTQVINSDGSSVVTNYDAAGTRTKETDYHADGSKDVFLFNITGQTYTTEHDIYDATGFLTTLIRKHADGSMAFKLVQSADGTKTTDWYDANGVLTSEVLQKPSGYSATTVYTNGVKTAAYITNADMSHDNYSYNITGQSYTTQYQHLDPTGQTTEVTRWHADGSLDYTQVVNDDGSSVVTNYDTAGVKKTETDYHADGSKDVFQFNIVGQTYTNEHDSYDSTGFLTDIVRTHADNSLAFTLVQSADGTKTSDWYDANGVITSEVTTKSDGYSSTTVYNSGVKSAAYIKNADGTSDNWNYNITGQSYTTQHQHLDASGKMVELTRTHADGTLDYTQVIHDDGSKLTDIYNSAGNKTQEIANNADGSKDVFLFNFNGQTGTTQHENYNSASALQFFDQTKTDGTHNVTAVASGVTIHGGAGNDVFSAAPSATTVAYDHGQDQILNFQAGDGATHDVVQISKLLAADYSHLQMTQSGTNALITFSANDSILLKNVYVSSLTSHDFLFV